MNAPFSHAGAIAPDSSAMPEDGARRSRYESQACALRQVTIDVLPPEVSAMLMRSARVSRLVNVWPMAAGASREPAVDPSTYEQPSDQPPRRFLAAE